MKALDVDRAGARLFLSLRDQYPPTADDIRRNLEFLHKTTGNSLPLLFERAAEAVRGDFRTLGQWVGVVGEDAPNRPIVQAIVYRAGLLLTVWRQYHQEKKRTR